MTEKARSPFGSRVHALRRERKWSQAHLAAQASLRMPSPSPSRPALTARTVGSIERLTSSPAEWHPPRPNTVNALIAAFDLRPGMLAHQELLDAAAATRLGVTQDPSLAPAAATFSPATPRSEPTHPFIAAGRETHLTRIAAGINQAASGVAQALFLGADPGTGKTWLITEACRRALDQHPDLVVLWGSSTGRLAVIDPYQPFRQVLSTMVGDARSTRPDFLISSDNVERIANRIPVALEALDTTGRGLLRRLLPISTLRNTLVEQTGSPRLTRLAGALASQQAASIVSDPDAEVIAVLKAYATAGPVVLVLEDLHWTDHGTVSILNHLLKRLRDDDTPLLLLASFRPGEVYNPEEANAHPLPPLLQLAPGLSTDPLMDLSAALTPDAGEAFIQAMAEQMGLTLDSATVTRIQEQTLGLPLVVEGYLRMYQAGAPGISGAPLADPDQIMELVLNAEFDLLTPLARQVLMTASVQGHGFALEPLAHILGMSQEALTDLIDDSLIWRYRLIVPGGTTTIANQDVHEYQFSHLLFRDHLYFRLMTELERAYLHQQTANALLDIHGDDANDATATIAFHLDRGGEPMRAARFWLQAGHHAFDASQFDRAEQAFARIRALPVRQAAPELEAEALLGLALCSRALDRRAAALEFLRLALDLTRRRGLTSIEARALSSQGMLAYDAGEVARGSELLREAIRLNEKEGDFEAASRTHARLSHNLHGLGLYDEAVVAAQRGIALATRIANTRLINGATIALANCWLDIGRYEEAIALYEASLGRSREAGDMHRANICLLNVALCRIEQGDWDAAARANDVVLEPGRSVVPRFIGVAEFQAGLIAEGRGDHDRARRHFQMSLDIRRRNGQEALLIDALAGLLRTAVTRNEPGTVRRLLGDIDDRVTRRGLDGIEHVARVCIGMMTGARLVGNHALAHRHAAMGREFVTTRAARLALARDRQTYLETVTVNRQLLDLAATVTIENPDTGQPTSIASD